MLAGGGDDGEDTRNCTIEGEDSVGLEPALDARRNSDAVLKVLMVHGIGSHAPGYAGTLSANLAEGLGLGARAPQIKQVELRGPSFPGESLGVLSATRYSDAAQEVPVPGELPTRPVPISTTRTTSASSRSWSAASGRRRRDPWTRNAAPGRRSPRTCADGGVLAASPGPLVNHRRPVEAGKKSAGAEQTFVEMYQIRYFLAVARRLNFTRAAEECHVSQPALTRAIQALEAELGGELLRRERTLTHLTELGQRMLPMMQHCYDSAMAAKSLARQISTGDAPTLSLAIARTVDVAVLVTPLAELVRVRPRVRLNLAREDVGQLVDLLKRGEAELALAGPLGEAWERLDAWPLFTETFALVVGREHRLANGGAATLEQLAGERLLVQAESDLAERLASRLDARGIATAEAHKVSSADDLVALVAGGIGVAIVPRSVAAARADEVQALSLEGLDLSRTVAIYGVAGRARSPVATMLLNLLRAADWSRRAA